MIKNLKMSSWLVVALASLSLILLSAPAMAASTLASPAFGDPVDAHGAKVTGEAAKCKPSDSGCKVVGYKCYESAKRSYYVNNSSECGVEDDDYVKDKDGNKVCVTDKDGNCKKDENGATIYQRKGTMYYLNIIINVVLGVLGVVAVAMIIMGGIQYTTSQGDPAKAQKAQKTIIFSVVGLVIALLAFAIVNFVLTNVFK